MPDGPYPHLVLGTVVGIASDDEAAAIFNRARRQGFWADLPDDPAGFLRAIQIILIAIPSPQGFKQMALLMERRHFDIIQLAVGDFVRYQPNEAQGPGHSFASAAEAAYWHLSGCIAVLCRSEDRDCPNRYVPGVYGLANGLPLDPDSGMPQADGTPVDPWTYRPIRTGG